LAIRGEHEGNGSGRAWYGIAFLLLGLLACLVLTRPATAVEPEPDPEPEPTLKLTRIASFGSAIDVRPAPGFPRLLFVTDISGRVWVLRNGKKIDRPFLNIADRVRWASESGMYSIAFPPDYAKSRRFYVYYVDRKGDIRLDEFRRKTAVRAARNTMRNVLTIRHRASDSHYGGHMHFDGNLLYVATGDGGLPGDPFGWAQDPHNLLGKMLRINPKRKGKRPYTVPATNPYIGRGRPEVFAIGFRNPYRWTFDRYTSPGRTRLALTDVGFDRFEEVTYLPLDEVRGANFGWPNYEGRLLVGAPLRIAVMPTFVLPHPENCAIVGGMVVRDRSLPSLLGRYLFSDFCNDELRSVVPGQVDPEIKGTGVHLRAITSLGEGPAGGVYATTYMGGLYRLSE
jgi:glucose/arabinose dehydrogenase